MVVKEEVTNDASLSSPVPPLLAHRPPASPPCVVLFDGTRNRVVPAASCSSIIDDDEFLEEFQHVVDAALTDWDMSAEATVEAIETAVDVLWPSILRDTIAPLAAAARILQWTANETERYLAQRDGKRREDLLHVYKNSGFTGSSN